MKNFGGGERETEKYPSHRATPCGETGFAPTVAIKRVYGRIANHLRGGPGPMRGETSRMPQNIGGLAEKNPARRILEKSRERRRPKWAKK